MQHPSRIALFHHSQGHIHGGPIYMGYSSTDLGDDASRCTTRPDFQRPDHLREHAP